MQSEHPTIRMVSEKVDLYVGRETYRTVANFVFHNDGPATTVKMGFPESSYGDIDSHRSLARSGFHKFSTSVDGRITKAVRRVTYSDQESVKALWIKTVPFQRNQYRRVRVAYESTINGYSSPPFYALAYDFTGGNWHGGVASSVLTVHMASLPSGTYLVSMNGDTKSKPGFRREGQNLVYSWKNWQAQDGVEITYDTTLPGWLNEGGIGFDGNVIVSDLDIPEKDKAAVQPDLLPMGVERNRTTYVSLSSWLDRLPRDGSGRKRRLARTYNRKTRTVFVQDGTRSVQFLVGGKDGSFIVRGAGDYWELFVPASRLEQEFGARFEVHPPDHVLRFLN